MKEIAPLNETKHEKFKRLATKRTNSIINGLRILGNLSNKANYDYSEEEIRKVFSTVESQLKITKAKFAVGTKKEFKL